MKTLKVNIFNPVLIKCNEINDFLNLEYKMYAIISIPRMYFKEPKCEDSVMKYTVTNRKKDFHCNEKIEFEGDSFNIDIQSEYPCEYMLFNNEKMVASDLFLHCDFFDKEIKIEYIGISSKHTATERLRNHATLQKILAKFQSEHYYDDLYICLFNALHFDIKTLDFNASNDEINDFANNYGDAYDKDEIVTALVEASLINIFKPVFNDEYSRSSSDAKFETLDDLYNYGFDNCIIHLSLFNENKNDKSGNIRIFTDNKSIELNKENQFQVFLECPFRSLKNEN